MNKLFSLEGKVALVTGGASGIGAKCVEILAQCGASVMATDINETMGIETVSALKAQDLNVAFCQHDASKLEDWDKAITTTLSQFGGLDILVNNAGIYIGGTLISNNVEQLQRINKINVESVFLGMNAAANVMKPGGKAGKGGSIINLSSIAGLVGAPGHSIYGATKGAVRSFSKHAAVEFSTLGYGVRVNSVHPGVIETPMGEMVFEDFVEVGLAPTAADAKNMILGMIPMGRLGSTTDIASMIAFLSSDAASYITGAEFVIDGGITAA